MTIDGCVCERECCVDISSSVLVLRIRVSLIGEDHRCILWLNSSRLLPWC